MRKVWHQLLRQQEQVGRDQVGRIMGARGVEGVRRGKAKRTTIPGDLSARPADLVDRQFFASVPNRLWLADITYVWTWSGFCYTSFITDAFARRIAGWRVSKSLRTDLALDALEMAICTRNGEDLAQLIHHSDRGVQGEINWSSQHLDSGGGIWRQCENASARFRSIEDTFLRQAGPALLGGKTELNFGRPLLAA